MARSTDESKPRKPAAPRAAKPAKQAGASRTAAGRPAAAKATPSRTATAKAPAKRAGTTKTAAKPEAKRARILPTTAEVRATPRSRAAAKPAEAKPPKAAPATGARVASATDAKAASAAGPRPRAARRKGPPADPGRLERLVAAAVKSLEDDKAEDVTVLDVTGRASFTDRMIIATGLADRQIQAMAAHLDEALGKEGLKLRKDAVQASEDWVLIDAGDLVIHLFKPEARLVYDLEKMWGPDSPIGEAGPGEVSPI